jgi:hypothetical protein
MTNKHGGKRRGAGRPPLSSENTVPITLTLRPSDIAYLSKLGQGNVSAGVKKLIERETAS